MEITKSRKKWMVIIREEMVWRRGAKILLNEGFKLLFRTLLPADCSSHVAKFIRWKVPVSEKTLSTARRADPKYFWDMID